MYGISGVCSHICQRECGGGRPSIAASAPTGFCCISAREAVEATSELSLYCSLARREGRHLPDIAYYMKGGINRNESEGEQAVFDM